MKKRILGWRDAVRFEIRARLAKVSRFFYARKAAFKALPIWKKIAACGAVMVILLALWWCL